MATRCAIIRKVKDGFEGIGCDAGGEVSGVGVTLQEHYRDAKKLTALFALGDISYLGRNVAPRDDYRHKASDLGNASTAHHVDPDATMAHARDHDDKGKERAPKKAKTLEALAALIPHDGCVYVFADGEWTFNGRPLAEAIAAQ